MAVAKKQPKGKPDCRFDDEWAQNVTNSLDDLYEFLEDILAEVQGKVLIPELEAAIMKNAFIARFIDIKVPDSRKKTKTINRKKT
jgi:hypothetical protein